MQQHTSKVHGGLGDTAANRLAARPLGEFDLDAGCLMLPRVYKGKKEYIVLCIVLEQGCA
jgi:stress response protein SCP2